MIRLTPEMERYLKLQRTDLAGLSGDALAEKFQEQIDSDYDDIATALSLGDIEDSDPLNVLDIGCGVGGIDWAIYKRASIPPVMDTSLHLLDKDGDYVKYGYKHAKDTGFYNKLMLTRDFLVSNGVPPDRITCYTPEMVDDIPECNLIVSLISCGFHYPVDVYLSLIMRCLSPKGVLVLDIRKGSKQEYLKRLFKKSQCLREYEKHERMAYWK